MYITDSSSWSLSETRAKNSPQTLTHTQAHTHAHAHTHTHTRTRTRAHAHTHTRTHTRTHTPTHPHAHPHAHKHPGGPGTGPWLLKNSCFAVAPARFHVGNNHEKKTSVLVWFATLAGFCASKPGERSKWSFLFTAWEILQLRQWRSASRSQCVPISIGDFECIWTTNHCVCLGLGNECCLELTFSSISSSVA